ncbi:YhdP family protein [Elongatibacter sediminis]|uniref:YhdP family protein n=1 Tax=Elongatibacter sediminis TaxID=3119006 RepID=A0AAW9RK61_9GAMM
MTLLRTVLRRARTLLWTAFSIVIILAAVLVGIGKLLMPYSERYQPQLEAWLSEEFGQPVVLDGFSGEWNAFGPRLRLSGMHLKSPRGQTTELTIDSAALDLKPLNALLPGRAWYNFLVIGADFTLIGGQDGGFRLSGLRSGNDRAEPAASPLRNLVGIGELVLEDSRLEYRHPEAGVRVLLTGIDAVVEMQDEAVALSLNADLSDEATGRVYGELEGGALLTLDADGGLAEARWHLSAQDLMLDVLHGRLPDSRFIPYQGLLNGEFWGDWLVDRPLVVRGVGDLRNGRLEHSTGVIEVDHANARLGWTYGGRGDWRLDLHELSLDDGVSAWTAPDITLARDLSRDVGLWISADILPLDVSLRLARDVLALYGTPWPDFLPGSAEGRISDLDLVLDSSWRLRAAFGQARDAGVRDWSRWPTLSGIDADIDLSGGHGVIDLHARELLIDWPRMFANPLRFSMPSCQAGLDVREGWQIALEGCSWINDDLAMEGGIVLSGNTGRPAVDANFHVTRGRIDRFDGYWPLAILKPKVLDWLRRSLVGGEIEDGRFQIHGDMDDWPFRNRRGRFEAIAKVRNATLDYRPGWPRAESLDATVYFEGPSMRVETDAVRVGGVPVSQASASIADFKQARLMVDYAAESDLSDLVGYLRDSPILGESDEVLDRFAFSGPASVTGSLSMPLGTTPGEFTLDGRGSVRQAAFADPDSGVELRGLTGSFTYDRWGMFARELAAEYREAPAVVQVSADARPDAPEHFRADLTGRFEADTVIPDFLRELPPLQEISGRARWLASVVVPPATESGSAVPWLEVSSDLVGMDLTLPDPLRKPPADAQAFHLRYPLAGNSRMLELDLAGRAAGALEIRMAGQGEPAQAEIQRAVVALGQTPAALPPPGFLRVQGNPESLDLDGWTDLVTELLGDEASLGSLTLERFEIEAGEIRFLDRLFADVGMTLMVNPGDIRAEFSSEGINGHVLYTPSPRGGSLTAEFDRLVLDRPVTEGISMRSDPSELPELHLYARSFRYADIEMGETRIEAYPTAAGFHFEKVEAESDSLNLRATGDWLADEAGPRSDFRILVTTESLGEFLESVDISSSLEGGQTVLRFNAWWPGSPAAFALSRLNGEVEFSVTRGQITNASAGGGRLLGLLSVQALPRRLSLDFRDVFDSGFDFEEAHGTFRMENGMAITDDVELASSAAKISLRGSTDLVAQRYDQIMTVKPGVGNTLPVLGAIAGGPGGAAAGLALQGLLHDELGEATQVKYTITGSWEQPSIEPVLEDTEATEPAADGP